MPTPVPKAKPVSRGVLNSDAPPVARADSVVGNLSVDGASPDERVDFRQKLHSSVFSVVERLRKKETVPGAEEAKFIRNGKAEVQIWLTDKSAEALAQLKQLGFEVMLDPKTSKVIIGRIQIEKLEALAALKFVRYVSPQFK